MIVSLNDPPQVIRVSRGVPPVSNPFTDQTVADTIAAPRVAGVRTALLEALKTQGVTVDPTVDVARLSGPDAGAVRGDSRGVDVGGAVGVMCRGRVTGVVVRCRGRVVRMVRVGDGEFGGF